jgi:hypothetical protein
MAVKFQFQFAGVDFSRPSSPYRKWLRILSWTLGITVLLLAYWAYLHHLMPGGARPSGHFSPPAPASAAAAKPTAPAPPTTKLPPMLKKITDDGILALGKYLLPAIRTSPVSPSPTTLPSVPEAKPVTVAVAAPSVAIDTTPAAPRPYRVHTDQERLLMAGQTAFANVIAEAGKYPDAYGFEAGDFLSDAKLGEPMPIYTVEATARANYKLGQPVKPLLKTAKQWMFPVMMGERICCMVSVMQTGRDYVPGPGSRSLAMAWSRILEKWPAEQGYHPLLLINPDIPGYYFTVPELSVQNITDTIEMFYIHPGLSPADVILASWR